MANRAVYYDSNYAFRWTDQAIADEIRYHFVAAGYELLNANELKTWMDALDGDKVGIAKFEPHAAPNEPHRDRSRIGARSGIGEGRNPDYVGVARIL